MEEVVKVIFSDNDILVVNKPSGIVVNRSDTYRGSTIQDWVEGEIDFSNGDSNSDFFKRCGIVHRLDKDTSGVLVVAKNEQSFSFLQKQFKERLVEKVYIALVNGEITDSKFQIDAPLGRNRNNPLKFAVVSTGKPAFTEFEKISDIVIDKDKFTLLRVYPKTGRTHQIRVHLSATNHPVVLDSIYCSNNILKSNEKYFNRLMLHSQYLSLFHPKTNKKVKFEAPLPRAFNL